LEKAEFQSLFPIIVPYLTFNNWNCVMASARLISAKLLLSRRAVLRNAICLSGILAVIVLPSLRSKPQIHLASEVKPIEIQLSSSTPAGTLIGSLTDSVIPGQHPLHQFNHTSLPANQEQAPSRPQAIKAKRESDLTIIPKIDVYVSAPQLWADGQTPAVVSISLKAVKGSETWNYAPREELVFELESRNVIISPSRVKIAAGATTSEPAIITAKKADIVPLTCTPERQYAGLVITNPQPENIEFITPIDAIGIESSSDTCQVNIAVPFEIFLYNKKDPNKTRLRPRSPISVQIVSESGNGKITTGLPIQLTEAEFSKYIDYVGTKTGADTIKAIASYKDSQIFGINDHKIVFPLWIFLSGLAGSLLGSGVRFYRTIPSGQNLIFFESLFYGVVVCIILIIYPVGTKLPEISNYTQPLLLFVLGALVSAYGPQSLHWALSFVPKGSVAENG
jgi:hypothetical protein